MKTCKELYQDREQAWHTAWTTYNAEIGPAVKREFPIGSKVRFSHGLKKIKGVVTKHGPDYSPDKVIVRNTKTGTEWEKEARELEIDDGQATEKD